MPPPGNRPPIVTDRVDPAFARVLRQRLGPKLARWGWLPVGRGAAVHFERTDRGVERATERLWFARGAGRDLQGFAVWMEIQLASGGVERLSLASLLPDWKSWLPVVGRFLRRGDHPWSCDAAGADRCLLDLEFHALPWFRIRNPPQLPRLPRAKLPRIDRTPYGRWHTRTPGVRRETDERPQWRQAGHFPVYGGGLLIGDLLAAGMDGVRVPLPEGMYTVWLECEWPGEWEAVTALRILRKDAGPHRRGKRLGAISIDLAACAWLDERALGLLDALPEAQLEHWSYALLDACKDPAGYYIDPLRPEVLVGYASTDGCDGSYPVWQLHAADQSATVTGLETRFRRQR